MEYRLVRHNESRKIYAIREDRLATGPLPDNAFRDNDDPDATIRVDWASDQDYATPRPELWESDSYTVLATDRDPLSAVVDQPQSLDREEHPPR